MGHEFSLYLADSIRDPVKIIVDASIKTGQPRSSATNTGTDYTNELMTTVFPYHQRAATVAL